uniref:Uncharacterized protein n=1 Tax=Salix viminalis TaxID=40686 RepID=A0A6N2L2U5_SALVM
MTQSSDPPMSNMCSQGRVVSELFDLQSPTPTLSVYPLYLKRNLSGVWTTQFYPPFPLSSFKGVLTSN